MHTGRLITKTECDNSVASEKGALRVVIAYDEVTAGKHAMQLLQGVSRNLDGTGEVQITPWSFHLLADKEWQSLANGDAEKADLLIVATSKLHPSTSTNLQWFEAAIGRMRGNEAAIVSLRSPEENSRAGGSAFQEAIRSAALQAGLIYFSSVMQFSHTEICQRIQQRADLVTPVLDKILHQPTPLPVSRQNT